MSQCLRSYNNGATENDKHAIHQMPVTFPKLVYIQFPSNTLRSRVNSAHTIPTGPMQYAPTTNLAQCSGSVWSKFTALVSSFLSLHLATNVAKCSVFLEFLSSFFFCQHLKIAPISICFHQF